MTRLRREKLPISRNREDVPSEGIFIDDLSLIMIASGNIKINGILSNHKENISSWDSLGNNLFLSLKIWAENQDRMKNQNKRQNLPLGPGVQTDPNTHSRVRKKGFDFSKRRERDKKTQIKMSNILESFLLWHTGKKLQYSPLAKKQLILMW